MTTKKRGIWQFRLWVPCGVKEGVFPVVCESMYAVGRCGVLKGENCRFRDGDVQKMDMHRQGDLWLAMVWFAFRTLVKIDLWSQAISGFWVSIRVDCMYGHTLKDCQRKKSIYGVVTLRFFSREFLLHFESIYGHEFTEWP